ncbi:GBP1 [Auxenochlorella protothecoides x Auxenochlorella symbiontica]
MAEEEVMRVGRRVYVSNLAWKSSWQDLKDHFRSVGEVVYSNVIKDESGRSKGWGIVEFAQPEEAVAAISTLNGTDLGGRTILVREDREDRDVKQYNAENGIEAPAAPAPTARRRCPAGCRSWCTACPSPTSGRT